MAALCVVCAGLHAFHQSICVSVYLYMQVSCQLAACIMNTTYALATEWWFWYQRVTSPFNMKRIMFVCVSRRLTLVWRRRLVTTALRINTSSSCGFVARQRAWLTLCRRRHWTSSAPGSPSYRVCSGDRRYRTANVVGPRWRYTWGLSGDKTGNVMTVSFMIDLWPSPLLMRQVTLPIHAVTLFIVFIGFFLGLRILTINFNFAINR